jgi:hypothetical protein
MAVFAPQFAYEILLKFAEAAYIQNLNPATDIPAGYVSVGQITADPAVAAQSTGMAPIQRQQLLTALASCIWPRLWLGCSKCNRSNRNRRFSRDPIRRRLAA